MDKTLRYAKCCGKIWNLMCRLGYKPGLGLGRENQGIKKPIVLNLRESKDGLGYQGKDAPTQEPGKDDRITAIQFVRGPIQQIEGPSPVAMRDVPNPYHHSLAPYHPAKKRREIQLHEYEKEFIAQVEGLMECLADLFRE